MEGKDLISLINSNASVKRAIRRVVSHDPTGTKWEVIDFIPPHMYDGKQVPLLCIMKNNNDETIVRTANDVKYFTAETGDE